MPHAPFSISEATRKQVEQYAESHGVETGLLVEEALLHHLQVLRELPADILIPPRIVLTEESFEEVVDAVKNPPKPTKAMRALMRGKPVDGEP